MKKIIGAAVLALVALLAAAFLWLRYGSSQFISGLIASQTLKYSGAPLEMQGNPVLHLFPPRLVLEEIRWKKADGSCSLLIPSLSVSPSIYSLFTGKLELEEIVIEAPIVEYDALASSPGPDSSTASARADSGSAWPLEIGRLTLHKGVIALKLPFGEMTLKDANLLAENLRSRQEAFLSGDFVLDALLPEEDGKKSAMKGNLAFRGRARYYAPNLTVRQASVTFTALDEAMLSWLSPLQLATDGAINFENQELRLNSASLSFAQGRVSLKGLLRPLIGEFDGEGTLELDPARLFGLAPRELNAGASAMLFVNSPVRFRNSTLSLKEVALKGEATEGNGQLSFTLPRKDAPAFLAGSLAFRNLEIMPGHLSTRPANASGNDSHKKLPPFSSFPELDLGLSADKLRYGGFQAANVRLVLGGRGAVYKLDKLALDWAEGKLSGKGLADFPGSRFSVSAAGDNINAGLALAESGFSGFGGGKATFNADLSAGGLDEQALRSSLEGHAAFMASGVKIGLLEKIAAFIPATDKGLKEKFPETVQLFAASLTAKNGELLIDPIKLEAKSVHANGNGTYSLVDGKLGGRLDFGLGSLSLPLRFSGSASDITWSLGDGFLRQLFHDLP